MKTDKKISCHKEKECGCNEDENCYKNEERRARDEIDYYSSHKELDKFNYSSNLTSFFAFTAIVLAVVQAINGIKKENTLAISIFLGLALIIFILSLITKYHNDNTNSHFITRDIMIEKRYSKIHGLKEGEFKKSLEGEFNEIRGSFKKKWIKNLVWKLLVGFLIINIIVLDIYIFFLR